MLTLAPLTPSIITPVSAPAFVVPTEVPVDALLPTTTSSLAAAPSIPATAYASAASPLTPASPPPLHKEFHDLREREDSLKLQLQHQAEIINSLQQREEDLILSAPGG